jgi:hypothetical protein
VTTLTKPGLPQSNSTQAGFETKNVLNAYEILNAGEFSWPVNILRGDFTDAEKQTHENRGEAKQIIWNLRQKEFRSRWRGYGFVIDLSEREVAVPQSWDLPQPLSTPDYRVSLDGSFVATISEPQGRVVIAGILRESLKKHFRENASSELGDLWQDFDSFCQYSSCVQFQWSGVGDQKPTHSSIAFCDTARARPRSGTAAKRRRRMAAATTGRTKGISASS